MDDLISFLSKWQELIGALLGGLLGLMAALIVARDARRREQRVAAMVLTVDFIEISQASKSLRLAMGQAKVEAENHAARAIGALVTHGHPQISPLFEGHLAAVQLVNISLAAHCSIFSKIYRDFERKMERLAEEHQLARTGKSTLGPNEIKTAVTQLYDEFELAAEHAACGTLLIDYYILGKRTWWHRLKTRLGAPPPSKECAYILKHGEKMGRNGSENNPPEWP